MNEHPEHSSDCFPKVNPSLQSQYILQHQNLLTFYKDQVMSTVGYYVPHRDGTATRFTDFMEASREVLLSRLVFKRTRSMSPHSVLFYYCYDGFCSSELLGLVFPLPRNLVALISSYLVTLEVSNPLFPHISL